MNSNINLEKPMVLSLTPKGHIIVIESDVNDIDTANSVIKDKKIIKAFSSSQEEGLYKLITINDFDNSKNIWPNALIYWRNYINEYIKELCHQNPDFDLKQIINIKNKKNSNWLLILPPMLGAEYCTIDALEDIWLSFGEYLYEKISQNYNSIGEFLAKELPRWHQVGRVYFHLAENKQSMEKPFAFIATYATSLGADNKVKYTPLSVALNEYAGENNKKALLNLLQPINLAAKSCSWLRELVNNNDIYHPLAWTEQEAFQFLKSVSILETAGLVVKLPNWWKKRSRPIVQVTLGNNKNKCFSANELLNFDLNIVLDDKNLSQKELDAIMTSSSGLILLRGQWIEVDKDKLNQALEHWKAIQKKVSKEQGVSFVEGMRLLAGIQGALDESYLSSDSDTMPWYGVQVNKKIKELLQQLQNPEEIKINIPKNLLKTELRSYQNIGVGWLNLLTGLGLGACLADDMGLGKTIQIIALLLMQKKHNIYNKPSLLILPASLLINWKNELKKFAPSIKALILHSSEISRSELNKIEENLKDNISNVDIIITSYSGLLRQKWLNNITWNLIILDEAQAIKNPGSQQTKSVKKLQGRAKIALTGTPIENRLGDLWSLFDFICPGLLGSATVFKKFIKSLEKTDNNSYAILRKLVSPYILRRLKTDKKIISDLPDKTEVESWCKLSKVQAQLYKQSVDELAKLLESTEQGIKRRGLVLAYLTRLKQICNHPSQWLNDMEYIEHNSGKFIRLREICEEIYSRQEKVLIFTQYRGIIKYLQQFLATIFNTEGLKLDGNTPVKQRQNLVDAFQSETGSPFFVLSLKAAGTGLNLTAANHVIHFDRWWNPSVENQASDRAYRIGQKKNVLVHKFICKGTIEEKVNKLIESKKKLAGNILESGAEVMLTEMSDKELLNLVSLDINQAIF